MTPEDQDQLRQIVREEIASAFITAGMPIAPDLNYGRATIEIRTEWDPATNSNVYTQVEVREIKP